MAVQAIASISFAMASPTCGAAGATLSSLYELPRRSVPRLKFTSAAEMATYEHPVLIDESPSRDWPAARWSVSTLLERSRREKKFWKSASPLFRYQDESQAMTESLLEQGSWQPSYEEFNMTLSAFVEHCSNSATSSADAAGHNSYYYYTGEAQDEDGTVSADVQPIAPLLPNAADASAASGASRSNTWVSCAGTVMQAHYDLAHNTFVHLIGENKTFYLLPPSASHSLYMAPKGHPHFRSSLIPSLAAVDTTRFPLFSSLREVWVARLSPGDALYLPPGWIHHVHAGGVGGQLSVGVNIFSDGAQSARAAYEALEGLPVPFEADWPREVRLAAVPALMAHVLRIEAWGGLAGGGHAGGEGEETGTGGARHRNHQATVSEWFTSRWQPLLHLASSEGRQGGGSDLADCSAVSHPLLTTPHFRSRADDIGKGILLIKPPDLRRVLLLNYFDVLVSFTTGWDARRAARLAADVAAMCSFT